MIRTRWAISYAVSKVAQYFSCLRKEHWLAVQHIFRYLKGTLDLSITYGAEKHVLLGYTDSDYAGDLDQSYKWYSFLFNGGAVSWLSML